MLSQVRRRRLALPDSAIEIALLDWGGDGPLALLHHANGFCAAVWALVAERLSGRYHVIALDARGHGDSSKPEGADCYRWEFFGRDVLAVAEALAAEHPDGRVALGLGHSFGGSAILMASAERPDLFERNVLVDPVVMPPDWKRAVPAADPPGNALAEAARSRRQVWPSRDAARAKWLEKPLFADWDPKALDLYLAEGLADRPDGQVELKCSGETEAAIFEATGSFDLWSSASRVRTPTLIERAARGVFPRANYEQLAARMADAQICDIDASHLAPMQHPDRVVAPILEFTSRDTRRIAQR
jgi:pimeloyl-ACP methyl ester carboxylesterase